MARNLLVSILLCSFCFVFLLTNQAAGQAVYGSIFGTITDQTGAAVPNAKVTVTSVRQGTAETATTNDAGNYNVTHLIPGTYDVRIEATGFKKLEFKAIPVSADVSTRADGQFQVGGVESTVEVSAEAPQLKTDRADVATLLSEKQVEEAPIYNRNFTSFVLQTPGSQQQSWSHASSENPQGSLQTRVNGQTFSGTGFQLDGTENRDPILGIIVINPPLDSVTEAKITSQNYDAEFGQAIGGVVTSQTKSGSNSIHGTAFGFRRSDANQARDPFSNSTRNKLTGRFLPQTLWGQFGGSLGGPIIKNKFFIFGDYQGTRRKSGSSFTQTVPTLLVRNTCLAGLDCNLSEYLPALQVFDPQTGAAFPGNIIPAGRLSPQAVAILKQMPLPTGSGLISNFAANGTGVFNDDAFDIRSDFQATEKMHVFGRYSFANFNQTAGGAFGILGGRGFGDGGFAGQSKVRNQSIASGFDYALNSRWLTDFRFGYMKYHVNVVPNGVGTTPASDIGIPGLNLGTDFPSGQPGYFIGSFGDSGNEDTTSIANTGALSGIGYGLGINRCNCPLLESENQYQFVNNWTRIAGNHSIKFGGDIRYALNLRVPSDRHRAGELSFNQSNTANPGGGVALATFLLGNVTHFTRYVSTNTTAAERQKRWFFYGQDTWRATPKLTISYGLRWDIYFPETVNGKDNGGLLDLSTMNIRVAGEGKIDDHFNVQNTYTNFAPRLGVAYQLNPKTVVRMGYGRSYDIGVFGSIFGHAVTQNLPVLAAQDDASPGPTPGCTTGGCQAAVFTLAQGPQPQTFPAIPSDGLLPLPQGVFTRARPLKMRVPALDAYNVTVQRELSKTMTFEVAYVGNKTTHGFVANNPAFNANDFTVVGFAAGKSQNDRRLFTIGDPSLGQHYTQNIDFFCDCTSSNYNSLQTKLDKRFSHGLTLLAHYTWSKSLDHDPGYYAIDPKVGYGPDDFNRKHVFVMTEVYELPFGRGKQFMSSANRVADAIFGGWQINSVTKWESGLPFSPAYNECGADRDNGPCRPIIVGSVDTSGGRNGFFTVAPTGCTLANNGSVCGPYLRPQVEQFGDERNALSGPHFFNTDLSVFKNFTVTERVRTQLRAEFFNVFNHVNLGQPNGCIDCNGAGAITNLAPNAIMRQIQIGARVSF
jgi:outer membrane receptor protein involved in Fe transport